MLIIYAIHRGATSILWQIMNTYRVMNKIKILFFLLKHIYLG